MREQESEREREGERETEREGLREVERRVDGFGFRERRDGGNDPTNFLPSLSVWERRREGMTCEHGAMTERLFIRV